jgi:hypothetical protein
MQLWLQHLKAVQSKAHPTNRKAVKEMRKALVGKVNKSEDKALVLEMKREKMFTRS